MLVDRLTEQHVARFRRVLQERLPGHDNAYYDFGVALDIWTHFLGEDWARKNWKDDPRDPYFLLHAPDEDPFGGYIREQRVWRGSWMLRSVQHVDGFDHFLQHLRTARLRGAVAELAAVDALVQAGHRVRFRERVGVQGLDYDAEATINGLLVAVEVKAAEVEEESEPFRESLIRNRIGKAPSQLPMDMPSLLFIQIPSSWVKGDESERVLTASQRALRGTGRISAVVFMAEPLLPQPDGTMAIGDWVGVVENVHARHRIPNVEDIMDVDEIEVHVH